MNSRILKGGTLSAVLFASLLVSSAMASKLNVIASFSIIGDFALIIGGERITLRTLVGPDSDAHIYEPKPSDAIALAKADVILINGLQFEGFMNRLIRASETSAVVIETTAGAQILHDPAGGHYHYNSGKALFHAAPDDPHAWHSVANAKIYVENITNAFCVKDPAGCAVYRANANAYHAQLEQLDVDIRQELAKLPAHKRTFVIGHNAFRYFEHAYGVRFLSPKSVSTESEASAADVAGTVRDIRTQRAAAVFAENISNPRLVEQIASAAGLKVAGVLYSDALSAPDGPAANYISLMRHNVKTITRAVESQQ